MSLLPEEGLTEKICETVLIPQEDVRISLTMNGKKYTYSGDRINVEAAKVTEVNLRAVSYTHLHPSIRISPLQLAKCVASAVDEITPVSYTHLDVYKRQPFAYIRCGIAVFA